MEPDPAAAPVEIAEIHLVPDLGRLERIFPDDELAQPARHAMRERPFDRPLGGEGVRVDLAEARDPGVGVDTHDERVLAGVALLLHVG